VIAARAAFAANWVISRRLTRARAPADRGLEQLGIGQPRFLSCVVRLPPEIATQLAGAASGLGSLQAEHYLYPAGEIHLTVLGLRERSGVEDQVGEVLSRHPAFEVDVGALNASPATVFAELYPRGSGLRALRNDLRGVESHEHGVVSRWLRRRLAHANLVRFAAPVDSRLLKAVGALRRASFGRFEVGEVELVRTDKVLSGAGVRTLGRFRLR
jgi:hypothetical protein